MALEALSRVKDGEDPRHNKTGTVSELLPVYVRERLKPLRSGKEVERRLVKNMLPVIGDVPLAELHRRDINRVLEPVLAREARVEAARVFENVRAFLRWAVARGDLDHSPIEGVRKPQTPGPRERVLSDDEIRTLWNSLPDVVPPTIQNIIRLCLLTGQRVGEVAGIKAGELDAKQRLWTIPASRSKNKHSHSVPLTHEAFALAEAISVGEKLPSYGVGKIIRRAQRRFGIAQWTAHDLRRTAVTNMAKLGVSPIVLGHVINHRSVTKAGVTLSVYSQHTYEREKREALELWAAHLDGIVRGGAMVLPMKVKR
jgi:integrase